MNRLRIVGAGVALFMATLAPASRAAEPMTLMDYMALGGPAPTARLAYGPAPHQYVELFEPAGRGPFPVAVLIHGGCFYNSFEGMKQLRGMAAALAAHGVAAWSIDYRGLDTPGSGYPGTFEDVNAAMDLLAAQAPGRRLNIHRLVAVGHSAGAYLALWLAGRRRLPPLSPLYEAHPLDVREVVALGGTGDLRPDVASFRASCGLDLAKISPSSRASPPPIAPTSMRTQPQRN